ncbi:MAG: hypothetical protein SO253_02715 [Bacilli bacterium]|nr:hypothetical protein [Bacilli bacterium]
MISIEKLKDLANRIKFDMELEEYQTLQVEFENLLNQMNLIGEIENIDDLEPMTFPYELMGIGYREDIVNDTLTVDEVLSNVKEKQANMIKTKKVVG